MTHYDTLGVPPDADAPTIKRAYRRMAAKTHPDKGGNADKFHAVQRAADVLLNDERRKHYDETGDDEQKRDTSAEDMLRVAFNELINEESFTGDYIAEVRRRAQIVKGKIERDIIKQRRDLVRFEKLAKRVRANEGRRNLFADISTQRLNRAKASIEQHEKTLTTVDEVIKLLDFYADTEPDGIMSVFSTTTMA